jgi:hypothetical protein
LSANFSASAKVCARPVCPRANRSGIETTPTRRLDWWALFDDVRKAGLPEE